MEAIIGLDWRIEMDRTAEGALKKTSQGDYRFTWILFNADAPDDPMIAIEGFRLRRGHVIPPSSKSKYAYLQIITISLDMDRAIKQAVEKVIEADQGVMYG